MKPISRIDPEEGQLFFRGLNVANLALDYDFESILYLLIHSSLPSAEQHDDLVSSIIRLRESAMETLSLGSEQKGDCMSALVWLSENLNTIRMELRLDQFETLLTMVALTPIVIANSWRECEKLKLIEPRTDLNHVANFIWTLTGSLPATQDLKDFETTVILHMDDPDNPSLSALERGVKAGVSLSEALGSALLIHGDPLHHGAGLRAMKMIEDIADRTMVRAKLAERLDSGQRIFGIGHRIYRTIDPRAVVLRKILKKRASGTRHDQLYKLVEEVASVGPSLARERKGLTLHPNVDLYNAAVYTTLGITAELNTSLFAMARTAGWMAHILDWKATPSR